VGSREKKRGEKEGNNELAGKGPNPEGQGAPRQGGNKKRILSEGLEGKQKEATGGQRKLEGVLQRKRHSLKTQVQHGKHQSLRYRIEIGVQRARKNKSKLGGEKKSLRSARG